MSVHHCRNGSVVILATKKPSTDKMFKANPKIVSKILRSSCSGRLSGHPDLLVRSYHGLHLFLEQCKFCGFFTGRQLDRD